MPEPKKSPQCISLILNDAAQVLMLKQENGLWTLPVSPMLADETPVTAVHRLTKEITGLTMDELECFGYSSAAAEVHSIERNGELIHPHCFMFASTAWQGNITITDRHQGHEFFSLAALPDLAEPMQHYFDTFVQWLPERGFLFV